MEFELAHLLVSAGFISLPVLISLLATTNKTWPSEDPLYYAERSQRLTKWSKNSDRKSSTVQTPKTSPRSREFRPEQIIEAEPTVRKLLVGDVMGLPQHYCFQGQGLNVARIMMRENHLQSLPVLDVYKRIVGTITMREIATFEQHRRK
jgi:hypothetical protein